LGRLISSKFGQNKILTLSRNDFFKIWRLIRGEKGSDLHGINKCFYDAGVAVTKAQNIWVGGAELLGSTWAAALISTHTHILDGRLILHKT
jgi:hypothetical protein